MFQFKQFCIEDRDCAMKIGTDGVLLGAWAQVSNNCLDIGTGTGLISLMIAQRFPNVTIDAIELDEAAYSQAKENILRSPWKDRISLYHSSLQEFQSTNRYDSIVCNPPYFKANHQIKVQNRKLARMNAHLKIEELAEHCSRLLSSNGTVSIVYPYENYKDLVKAFSHYKLYLLRITIVKGNLTAKPKRVLLEFSNKKVDVANNELTIEVSRHNYTKDYVALTKDFYLKM